MKSLVIALVLAAAPAMASQSLDDVLVSKVEAQKDYSEAKIVQTMMEIIGTKRLEGFSVDWSAMRCVSFDPKETGLKEVMGTCIVTGKASGYRLHASLLVGPDSLRVETNLLSLF